MLYYEIGKNYLSRNKTQSTADDKKAKLERKEDANTKTTHDVLSKRKPKPSVYNLSAALQAVNNPLENKVGIHGQQ